MHIPTNGTKVSESEKEKGLSVILDFLLQVHASYLGCNKQKVYARPDYM